MCVCGGSEQKDSVDWFEVVEDLLLHWLAWPIGGGGLVNGNIQGAKLVVWLTKLCDDGARGGGDTTNYSSKH